MKSVFKNETEENRGDRAALRRAALAARVSMTSEEHECASALIEARLNDLLDKLDFRKGAFAFCWPIRREFDTRPVALRLLAEGWRIGQPVVETPDAGMIFRAWNPESAMTVDRHGIPIPLDGAQIIPSVIVLPIVAFDEHGYRLGYGGGYFDRTLATASPRPFSIGVGFERGRVSTIHPQPHDIPMDAIVTESTTWLRIRP